MAKIKRAVPVQPRDSRKNGIQPEHGVTSDNRAVRRDAEIREEPQLRMFENQLRLDMDWRGGYAAGDAFIRGNPGGTLFGTRPFLLHHGGHGSTDEELFIGSRAS